MRSEIKKLVILGGGTAGWMSAALLKKVLGASIDISLVESESIGTVGVGEATIPPIKLVNSVLGLNEAEFIKETKATFKLAIKFENWKNQNESYFHTFGAPGKSVAFCHFHHYWQRAQKLGMQDSLWDYDLNYLCCEANKFAFINAKDPIIELPYAYHFDATLYAAYLRKLSEAMGVTRIEGKVEHVTQCQQSGNIQSLQLDNQQIIDGDLFIDCSGFKAMLIQQALGVGYDDWSHWLPCDSAVAVASERHETTAPYTRSIAHSAGWQWRIPLQHRNGNGLVYCSRHLSSQAAESLLLKNIDTAQLSEPNHIKFTTGRRRKQWHKNVIAIGLSSGFLEPLESTSIHLIQSAIVRLLQLFPHNGLQPAQIQEYNQQSELEYAQIRDFLILHYHQTERTDSQFWRDLKTMTVPDSLTHKIALFQESGRLFREQNDLFLESSWLQVLFGQGVTPDDYHPLANTMAEQQLLELMKNIKRVKHDPIPKMPSHDEFIKTLCQSV